VQQACANSGLDPSGATLIHHYSNAIYLLPVQNAVARVTQGRDMAEQVGRSQAVTRWLTEVHQFPAARPLGDTAPVIVEGAAVSFWNYYPQPAGGPPLTSAHLAVLLRLLHQIEVMPVVLPAWIPLESLQATIEDPEMCAVLTGDERAWIGTRIDEVRMAIAGLDWPLGIGLIHGDAWAGNLLACTGAAPVGVALGDWDWVSVGPREVDLIPTWHAAVRYGKGPGWVTDFSCRYGYDLAAWGGYPVLMAMRDLVQLTGPIRRARDAERYRQVLRQRLDGLRAGDTSTTWKAL
jgi:aminoglycoside phosphotransferase (APT) family kinase protein